jgi:hypothetical protein
VLLPPIGQHLVAAIAVIVRSDGSVRQLGLLGPFLLQRLEQELRERLDDPLAHTGGNDATLALIAIAFLLAGAVAIGLTRRPPPPE